MTANLLIGFTDSPRQESTPYRIVSPCGLSQIEIKRKFCKTDYLTVLSRLCCLRAHSNSKRYVTSWGCMAGQIDMNVFY